MLNLQDPAFVQAFMGYFLAALAVLLAVLLQLQLRRCWASRAWPSTSALILASEVKEVDNSEDSYAHAVTYAYRVAGCDYTGNRIHFVDTTTLNQSRAARLATKYPPNVRVPVYYNPAKPGQSVLEPGFKWSLVYTVLWTAALALMAWRALK